MQCNTTGARINRPGKGFQERGLAMFKIIGAVVVYGFALLGLATYLETRAE
ncbi:hypothetical protein GCM10027066_25400 [Dyella jejuensis]